MNLMDRNNQKERMTQIIMDEKKKALARKSVRQSALFAILSLVVMIVIFIFSSQKGWVSSDLSNSFYETLSKMLSFMPAGFLAFLQEYIRKMAHIFLYLLLGAFTSLCSIGLYKYRTLMGLINDCTGLRAFFHYFAGWAVAVIYAVTDEIHQTFIPGRTCQMSDMALDAASALIATLFVALFSLKGIRKFRSAGEGPYNQQAI